MKSPTLTGTSVCVLLVIGLAALSGCITDSQPADEGGTSFVELAEEQFAGLAGVDDVAVSQSPRDPDADAAALDGLDAAVWNVGMTVTTAENATAGEVAAAAEAALAFSDESAVDNGWTARLDAGRETTLPTDDVAPRRAISIQVFPAGKLPLSDVVEGMLRMSQAPGVDTVSTFRDRASVTSVDALSLLVAFDSVSAEALLTQGGEYDTTDGRVQLTVLSDQVSPVVVRALITQAALYPEADFALVAPLDGPSAPSVFVNGVTDVDSAAILLALGDPALADEIIAPFVIPIAIRAGTGDQTGFVGDADPVP